MYERGKSDGPVVPAKPPNNTVCAVAEERGPAKGNTASTTHPGRSAGSGVPSGLERVREVARRDRKARFTALLHHVSIERLRAAYRAIRPQAAPGVDGLDVGGLRPGFGRESPGLAPSAARRKLPGEAVAAVLYPEGGWAAAAAGYCHGGGQDSSTCRR
jgi:hypothetical protein